MRISDWSSDVCSSDLVGPVPMRVKPMVPGSMRSKRCWTTGATQATALACGSTRVILKYGRKMQYMSSRTERCRQGFLDLTAEERSEEHTSELQSLMRITYSVFRLINTTYSLLVRHNKNI